MPRVRLLQEGPRAVLHGRRDLHLQRRGQAPRRHDLRRLLGEGRGRRGVLAQSAGESRSCGRRPAAVRGHHHMVAAQALEGRTRQEGRHRRPRRARTHGRQVRTRARRAHGAVHDIPRQGRRRPTPWRARGRDLEGPGRDGQARVEFRSHHRHGLGRSLARCADGAHQARRHDVHGRRAAVAAADRGVQRDPPAPQPRGLVHRRYRRDAGDA